MLREVENARDKLLYDQIMASHCSLPSPRPPPSPRMLSLSIPLLHRHPEVIGPSRRYIQLLIRAGMINR